MPPSDLHVTVFQEAPQPRDPDANAARVAEALAASPRGLVVFPELFLSGYRTADLHKVALPPGDHRIEALAQACRDAGSALLIGYVEPAESGFYDAYLAIDCDGAIRPPIRKTHLFGGEREAFLSGDALEPVELCGARVGVINCFELEFPEVARTLALRGAELLVAGSANMHPYEIDHRTAAVARALENRLPLAYANRVGSESGHDFCGLSIVVDRDGRTLGELGTDETGTIRATLDLASGDSGPTDMLAQRRPELYAR